MAAVRVLETTARPRIIADVDPLDVSCWPDPEAPTASRARRLTEVDCRADEVSGTAHFDPNRTLEHRYAVIPRDAMMPSPCNGHQDSNDT